MDPFWIGFLIVGGIIVLLFMIPILIGIVMVVGTAIFGVWLVGEAGKALEAMLPDLEKALGALGASAVEMKRSYDDLSPAQKQQLVSMLATAHSQYSQLNRMSQARYNMRMEQISGMAASAGISWQP